MSKGEEEREEDVERREAEREVASQHIQPLCLSAENSRWQKSLMGAMGANSDFTKEPRWHVIFECWLK